MIKGWLTITGKFMTVTAMDAESIHGIKGNRLNRKQKGQEFAGLACLSSGINYYK